MRPIDKSDTLLHYLDQGSQNTSEKIRRLMADNNLVCSMSRSGNVEGSAAMESFFSSLKADPLTGKRIAPEATLAQMRPITSSNSTIRSDFGAFA
jgi:transposase InsO family protein